MGKGKRLKRDRTGLRQMTKDQHEDFYIRWRDVMKALVIHGGILIVNDVHQPYFDDLLDRLKEDAWWKLGPTGGSTPIMMFHKQIPFDEMLVWTESRGVVPISEVMGNVGLGRYTKLGMASDEQRPWGAGNG